MSESKRCRHAHQRQRMSSTEIRLVNIPEAWDCGLALRECDGTKDPGCGRWEV